MSKNALSALAAVLALAASAGAYASTPSAPAYRAISGASSEPLPGRGLAVREELEAFIDGVMSTQLRSQHIAGATVAVVRDRELFFAKGYGYEDVEKKVPVDPEQTLFRVGSTSKLFTWTAIMQLVEEGALDLDADINTYLTDFKIPDTYPEPITIRNLLTHTPGFEDGGLGYLMEQSPDELVPLGEFLAQHMPVRVRPPTTDFASSTGAAYSNWGAALAGHIVATVTGMPFDEYIEQRILKPLNMSRSTFREPLPPELAARMSGGYTFQAGAFRRHGFEYIHNFGPAGGLSTTAADMTKFMIAHLQHGAVDDVRILREETAKLMHARALSPDPAVNGMCLGFYETWVNGRRLVGHGGATVYFITDLLLIPEAGVGLFVSTNSPGGGKAINELQKAFMDRYFPARLPDVKVPSDFAERAARYAGTYRALRRSYTRLDKVIAATGDIHVQPGPEGTLLISSSEGPAPWVEIGEGVFRRENDDRVIAFKGDDGHRASHLVGPFAAIASERIAWYDSARLHATLLGLGMILFIGAIVSAIRQRHADRAGPKRLRWARPMLAVVALLNIAFVAGFVLSLSSGVNELVFDLPSSLYAVLALPLIALLPTAMSALLATVAWKERAWTTGGRIFYSLATLSAIAFLWVINYWNLLGYRIG